MPAGLESPIQFTSQGRAADNITRVNTEPAKQCAIGWNRRTGSATRSDLIHRRRNGIAQIQIGHCQRAGGIEGAGLFR